MSLHGVFDVLLTDSFGAFQAHDVVEDERVILAFHLFFNLICFVLLKECNFISVFKILDDIIDKSVHTLPLDNIKSFKT